MRSTLVLGVLWSVLFALLAVGGHQPSFTVGLPVSAERYYATAAAYAIPLLLLLGWIFASVACGVAGVADELDALMAAWARPTAACFVLPDLVAYATVGFEGVAMVVRFTAPITAVAVLAWATYALVSRGAPRGRALGAAALGLLAQALPAAFLLR